MSTTVFASSAGSPDSRRGSIGSFARKVPTLDAHADDDSSAALDMDVARVRASGRRGADQFLNVRAAYGFVDIRIRASA